MTCKRCLKKKEVPDEEMQILRNGERRIKRDLDIRNLIKMQDMLKTFIMLKISDRKKRKLLRL